MVFGRFFIGQVGCFLYGATVVTYAFITFRKREDSSASSWDRCSNPSASHNTSIDFPQVLTTFIAMALTPADSVLIYVEEWLIWLAISRVTAPCSSTAPAIAVEISCIRLVIESTRRIASTACSDSLMIAAIC